MKSSYLVLLLSIFLSSVSFGQNQMFKIGCIGFYNLENLFDTLDTPYKYDEEYTPKGSRAWTTEIYHDKLNNMARIIEEIGKKKTEDGLAVLGVCEIENRNVLEDLCQHELLKDRNYQIIHYESLDRRGIDNALLYNPKYFKPISSRPIKFVRENKNGKLDTTYTRDILYVKGYFDKEVIHLFVNHWPSRSGGQAATEDLRKHSADMNRAAIDKILNEDPAAKIIVMGDMNDHPLDNSITDNLRAIGKKKKMKEGDLFNPMTKYYKKGLGTTAWNDSWGLFDQIIVSKGLLKKDGGYNFFKAYIHKPNYMITKNGRYKGYPLRTFSGDAYIGGYSDHFPVYLFLTKAI